MYSIIASDGREIGVTEHPNYIFKQDNGYYALCAEPDATGVCFSGQVYQLADRPAMGDDLPTIRIAEIDAGARLVKQEAVSSIAFVTLAESGGIDGPTAGEHMDMFAEWSGAGVSYAVGNLRRYNGKLYRCVQAHTSQDDWTPDTTASLWATAADPMEEWPEWTPPVGAHDAYAKGDKVSHNNKHWTSTVDANVWEPGQYGWDEVTE